MWGLLSCQERGYSAHKYIGLYKDKAVKAIGKITGIFEAHVVNKDNITNFKTVTGLFDETIESRIKNSIKNLLILLMKKI